MGEKMERIVSAAEAREEALDVTSWLGALPPPGQVFTLVYRGEPLSVMVVASPCECQQAPEPHAHPHIPLPGLPRGARVSLKREDSDAWRLEVAASATP